MASQQPGHNQDQPYQAYPGPPQDQSQQQHLPPHSGPGIDGPILQFNEGSGRYEPPASTHEQFGNQPSSGYGSGGYGGGGFGGEHEAGYQVPTNPSHEAHSESGFGGASSEHQAGYEAPPGLPPRRTDTGAALPQGQDRSHQVEVMQSYEMSRPQTEDEQNQAILQREFPKMDSSLIAAIYGDSGSLSATREMLQELASGDQ